MTNDSEATRLLVLLLARERALWRPFRGADWSSRSTAGRTELRAEYRAKGLRWSAGGSVAARKSSERQISELIGAGLIEASGAKGRNTHIKLTDRGRQVAEVLSGAPRLAIHARLAVCELLQFAPAETLISELLPAKLKNYGQKGYQEKLLDFQTDALPALVAGWIAARSDCHGRVAYAVTAAGADAAREEAASSAGEPVPEMVEHYQEIYDAERERLLSLQPAHPNEIGPIPLSAGAWGEILGPWTAKPQPKKSRTRKAKK